MAISERLYEQLQLRKLIEGSDSTLSAQGEKDLAAVEEDRRVLEKFAEEHGVKIPKRPSFTEVLAKSLTIGTEGESLAAIATAGYSAVAHAVPDMVLTYAVDRSASDWHPFQVGQDKLPSRFKLDLTVAVLLPYTRAVELQINAYGWPPSAWKKWLSHVRATLNKALKEDGRGST